MRSPFASFYCASSRRSRRSDPLRKARIALFLLAGTDVRLPSRGLLAWRRGNGLDLLFLGFLGFPIALLLAFGHGGLPLGMLMTRRSSGPQLLNTEVRSPRHEDSHLKIVRPFSPNWKQAQSSQRLTRARVPVGSD